MRPESPARFVASLTAVIALTLLGLSPAIAADPDATEVPTTAETPTPTPTPTAAAAETVEAPAATEDTDVPAEGLADVVLPDRTIPIPLPLPGLTLPLNLGSLNLGSQPAPTAADPQFGGGASGIYAEAFASDEIRVKSGALGAVSMKPDGAATGNTAAYVFVPTLHLPVLIALPLFGVRAEGVTVSTWGDFTYPDNRPRARAWAEVEDFSGEIYAANITAQNLHVNAHVERLTNGEYRYTGRTEFTYLSIYGAVNFDSKEIEPNRTHVVPGLGKVVLNEQKITDLPGDRRGISVTAMHITLSVAVGGWPVGTDIYIGNAEAVIYE